MPKAQILFLEYAEIARITAIDPTADNIRKNQAAYNAFKEEFLREEK